MRNASRLSLEAAHSEAFRATATGERVTKKNRHQSCRECLNISEGKNGDNQNASDKFNELRSPSKVAAPEPRSDMHRCNIIRGAVNGLIASPVRLRRGQPRETWTRSNKIRQDQGKSRLKLWLHHGYPRA